MEDTTTCPNCAETVESAAKFCRHCGSGLHRSPAPQTVGEQRAPRWVFPIVVTFIGIVGGGIYVATQATLHQRTETGNPSIEPIGKTYITRDFLDPGSAQFRNVSTTANCLIGEVNGKNVIGGYTGFKEFYYDARKKVGRVTEGIGGNARIPGNPTADLEDYARFTNERSSCILGT